MKREEEIINAGVEYTESRRPMCIGGQSYSYEIFQMNRNYAFEAGAKWADKTMIDKACAWLEQHKLDYNKYDAWIGEYVDFNALITDFKNKMEE